MSKKIIARILVYLSLVVLLADYAYKMIYGIGYNNKNECILYQLLPKWGFLFYEFFTELVFVVIVGIFLAVILEKYFSKYKFLYPKNPFTAFLYASVVPVCACTAIPLVESMKNKLSFKTILVFVIAAPLLNPYIIVLSVTTLGYKYALLRIVGAFILSYGGASLVSIFAKGLNIDTTVKSHIHKTNCLNRETDIFSKTLSMLKTVWIYILIAGAMGFLIDYFQLASIMKEIDLQNSFLGPIIATIIGTPIYLCNGADILFLQPLIFYKALPLGTAISFSLTSTAICITSMVMFTRFLGKKLTILLSISVVLISICLGILINVFI
ncbi:MAG: permease [Bacteroidales bacterium]|nr:permease [Bacteroidales bacterium]